ncbi:hypothetical protein [Phreatobacter stygius]|uniref:Uncharacterized protein n=1 Tax=Phreatobacter stygius TaxID=1940610 RepID=A0A4D7B305_9HYPH|nr:hypothetical protein [Phreatobacter stygius]QCI63956.1 hypothetical protein E8M01_06665 [Phreatobacter stygius]
MKAIEKVDWETVDFDKVVGDYVPLPDGSQHYIEMDMLHWHVLLFIAERGEPLEDVAQDALNVIADTPGTNFEEHFDELFKAGIMAFGRQWVLLTTGK